MCRDVQESSQINKTKKHYHRDVCETPLTRLTETLLDTPRVNQNTKQWQDAQILLFWSIFTFIWSWGKYEAECDSSDGYSISLVLWGNVFSARKKRVIKKWKKVPRFQLESYPIYSVRSCGKIALSLQLCHYLFLCIHPHGTDWQLRASHTSEPRQ